MTRYLSAPIGDPSTAWQVAAQWGSAMAGGDPGACMYGFDERFFLQSEDHRTNCLEWIEQCKADATRAQKRELAFLADYIRMAPIAKGSHQREFRLNAGTLDAADALRMLDSFTQGYIEALFFTSTGTGDDEDLESATVADLAPKTFDKIQADCSTFQQANAALLERAYNVDGYDATRAGADYWYTRNGHGVGYWDRGLGYVGDELSKTSGRSSSVDLYRGDDGLLYLM